ncbi:hypothetical protein [Muriicola soli]|uniref:Uncharacterized protein n=1 Tax=Muriicola soli TaxID=2507538 RepID=A0A411E8C6_9FLAO|nr:hypothetical protein [Muriicola soli]QBA63966.1 hypothetical protein EQY75_05090 [Muriicola soli]
MIKFYRKIRQKLLSENKFGKYLAYAIGEIVLVVIGILIALYINNRNQIRLFEERTDILMNEVLLDLENLIKASNYQLDFYSNKQIIFDLILNNKLTYDDYSSNKYPNLSTATTWYNGGLKQRMAYDNLTKEINAIPEKYKPVFKDLSLLYSNKFNENYRDLIENMSNENMKKRADKYEWYSYSGSYSENKEMFDYMLNDYLYKNEVKHYATIVNFHIGYILGDKNRAQKSYKEISTLLNKPIDDDIIDYNLDLFKNLVGEWETEMAPGIIVTVYEDKKRLFYKDNIDSIVGQFHIISNKKLINENRVFFTIVNEQDEIVVKQTGGINWKKVK